MPRVPPYAYWKLCRPPIRAHGIRSRLQCRELTTSRPFWIAVQTERAHQAVVILQPIVFQFSILELLYDNVIIAC